MDDVKKTSNSVRFREFDAKLERVVGQNKNDSIATAGFVGDGHVHFKGENLTLSKGAPPVEATSAAEVGAGKAAGGLPG